MSEFLRDGLMKDDGDDVEAHEFLKNDADDKRDLMANDEGDDVEAHSMLGPKDVMDGVMDKRSDVL